MNSKIFFRSSVFIKSVFIISLSIIFFISGVSYKHISNLSKSTALVVHTYKVSVELEQIISYLKDAETGNRAYIITRDTVYLKPFLTSREKINNTFIYLKELTKDNQKQQINLIELNFLIEKRLKNINANLISTQKNQIQTLNFKKSFQQGNRTMDAIRAKIGEMKSIENQQLQERQIDYNSDVFFSPIFLYILLLLTLLFITVSYYKISSDFKKLKTANDQLELFKEAANQSEIVSHHGNWVCTIKDNSYRFSNNFYRLLGVEPQSFEATIDNMMKFVHPKDVAKLTGQLNKMIEDEELPYIYYRIIRKDGEIRHLKAFGKALYDKDDNKRLLGTTTDITDEIENLLKLEERNIELERNNKELSAFNYLASHDLQEPLRKIQTFVSRLEDKEANSFSETGQLYLERIKNAASRMRSLIDDLLQFSRTNTSEKVFAKTQLNDLLDNAKQDLAELITENKATITSQKLPELLVIPFQIQQLFVNLIGNSLKYSKENTPPKINISYAKVNAKEEVDLKISSKGIYHKIIVEDNGIGFDQEYADKIFTLFTRLHNKEAYSGTGIGLSICRKIINNHNGFIYATGKPNVGAVFKIYLPDNPS